MKLPPIPKLSLYHYRYLIGYGLYSALLVILLVLHVTDIPRGLSQAEVAAVTHSVSTPVSQILLDNPINAPYVLLQKASVEILGLSTLAVRLPSIILALLTGLALALMLRQWFSDNIAVLSGIIVATAGPFMSMGRTGTALIMHAFWLSIILFAATKKLSGGNKTFKWKLLFFISAALSLYTPLMIYPLIAIAVSGLLHPHIRYALRQLSPLRLSLIAISTLVLLIPLIWSVVRDQHLLAVLLGLDSAATTLDQIGANAVTVGRMLFDFANPRIETLLLPLFSAAVMALVALGVAKTIADRYSARSYMLLLWMILIGIITLLNPSAITILYLPIILFLAVGIETLIREWYSLFPRNPYARIAGLIPISILLVSISASNVSRYFYGHLYSPDRQTSKVELTRLHDTLSLPALDNKPAVIVSLPEDTAFFGLFSRQYDNVTAADTPSAEAPAHVVTAEAYRELTREQRTQLGAPYRVITSGAKDDALELRVYVSR